MNFKVGDLVRVTGGHSGKVEYGVIKRIEMEKEEDEWGVSYMKAAGGNPDPDNLSYLWQNFFNNEIIDQKVQKELMEIILKTQLSKAVPRFKIFARWEKTIQDALKVSCLDGTDVYRQRFDDECEIIDEMDVILAQMGYDKET